MNFKTNKDKGYSLKLKNVKELMDNLVQYNVVLTTAGILKSKESAEIITTSEELDIE